MEYLITPSFFAENHIKSALTISLTQSLGNNCEIFFSKGLKRALTVANRFLGLVATSFISVLAACGGGSVGSGSVGSTSLVAAPAPTPSPSPTATTAAKTETVAGIGYVRSPTLDGAAPRHASFDVNLGLQSAGSPGIYGENEGAFRFICGGEGAIRYDDPIAFAGQPGKSHLHQVWGNAEFGANTTPDSLAASADTNCNYSPYSLNRSSYWQPALVNDQGEVIRPDVVLNYYKSVAPGTVPCTPGSKTFVGQCISIPNQIRFIFGWNSADPTGKVDIRAASWFCVGGPDGGHYRSIEEVFQKGCRAGNQLVANTAAPPCWDGKYLDTPDHRSHMAYPVDTHLGYSACPTTHPYLIPQQENKLEFTVTSDMYSIDAAGNVRSRIKLASDDMLPGAKPGETLHADYMEGWIWEAKKAWYDNCITKRLNCSGGDLGNGTALKGADKPLAGWKNPNPRLAISAISR